jgi:putative FmdB family regulatory protein
MKGVTVPKYDFACDACGAFFEIERQISEAARGAICPVCGTMARRVFTMPKLLLKSDPRDVRPVWHNHDGYSHAHAPRRGRHRTPDEDH